MIEDHTGRLAWNLPQGKLNSRVETLANLDSNDDENGREHGRFFLNIADEATYSTDFSNKYCNVVDSIRHSGSDPIFCACFLYLFSWPPFFLLY
jgi:hypothetical protein